MTTTQLVQEIVKKYQRHQGIFDIITKNRTVFEQQITENVKYYYANELDLDDEEIKSFDLEPEDYTAIKNFIHNFYDK